MRSVCFICLVALLLSFAQETIELDAPAVWLEAFSEGVAVLLADGTVAYITGDASQIISKGWLGDNLLECGGSLFGNFEGRLARTESDLFGPELALHQRPACLNDTAIAVLSADAKSLIRLDFDFKERARVSVNALPDAELILADLNGDRVQDIVLLSDPTKRYAHGVLGDSVEAASISVFDAETLEPMATYTLPEPFVFEQRRVTPFEMNAKDRLLATRSSNETGAGVVLLSLENGNLEIKAEAQPIGTGFRWLNLFASRNGSAYAVRTPHIGGPLQRYRLSRDRLEIESFQVGVTNHSLGSRNLDLGVLLPELESQVDHLVLPTPSLRALRLIRCDAQTCDVVDELQLGGRLSSNLTYVQNGSVVEVMVATGKRLITWTLEL